MLYTLKTKQVVKTDLDTLWQFMSAPQNLATITPPYMGFHILSEVKKEEKMYPGQIIEYHVTPLANIKMYWVTEITQVKDKEYFIDEQRFGPYVFWHHKHFFKPVAGGIEMADIIHYKPPFGILGKIANTLIIKKQLKEIFDYRYKKVEELFNG